MEICNLTRNEGGSTNYYEKRSLKSGHHSFCWGGCTCFIITILLSGRSKNKIMNEKRVALIVIRRNERDFVRCCRKSQTVKVCLLQ